MDSFSIKRLKTLRHTTGLTQVELGRKLGIAQRTVAGYESGHRTPPSDIIGKMADIFGVSTDYLYGRAELNEDYKPPQKEDSLLKELKDQLVQQTLREVREAYGKTGMFPVPMSPVPLLGTIPAGIPAERDFLHEETIMVPAEWKRGELRALRVQGDSMTGFGIEEGDIVVIRLAEAADPGEVVVVLHEGRNTLKKLVQVNGRKILRAGNSQYPDIILNGESRIQGVFIGVMRYGRPLKAEELSSPWQEVVQKAKDAGLNPIEAKAVMDLMGRLKQGQIEDAATVLYSLGGGKAAMPMVAEERGTYIAKPVKE